MPKQNVNTTESMPTPPVEDTPEVKEIESVVIPPATPSERMADVYIPINQLNPKDDIVTVTHNGRTLLLRRGVRLVVPAAFAMALEHSAQYADIRYI